MFKTVIVIPIYKEEMTPSEIVSLKQVKKVLKDYDLVYIAPIKMKRVFEKKNSLVEYWPDDCFKDITSYSKLLLTKEFYERFIDYEYMLIYQLDAFVFYDELDKFCSMGYDYMGAPIPFWGKWRGLKARVGNGGLSLRKIKSCIQVVENKEEIYIQSKRREEFELGEDQFFAYCGYDKKIDFYVPDKKTALLFCVEGNVMKCFQRLSEDNLPFACHGWSKFMYWDVWKPYIEKYIFDIEAVKKEIKEKKTRSYEESRFISLSQYLMERLLRNKQIEKYIYVIDNLIPRNNRYVLWGAGRAGHDALHLLNLIDRDVEFIISRDDRVKRIENIEVINPNKIIISECKCIFIVTVIVDKYIEEIEACLKENGLEKGKDYVFYIDIIKEVVNNYYNDSIYRWGRLKSDFR